MIFEHVCSAISITVLCVWFDNWHDCKFFSARAGCMEFEKFKKKVNKATFRAAWSCLRFHFKMDYYSIPKPAWTSFFSNQKLFIWLRKCGGHSIEKWLKNILNHAFYAYRRIEVASVMLDDWMIIVIWQKLEPEELLHNKKKSQNQLICIVFILSCFIQNYVLDSHSRKYE